MEGGQDDYLFWMNAQNICFFQLLKLNKYCLGVELDPAHQLIKKLKWIICGSTRCIPLHAATVTECDEKNKTKQNKKGIPVTEILNTCT